MSKFISLVGNTYGRLYVEKDYMENKIHICECICQCGNTINVRSKSLTSGHTKSCGCLGKDNMTMIFLQHGMTHTRFYRIWLNMKNRCYNPQSSSYQYYGGRGIVTCGEWHEFRNFWQDMYESYLDHVKSYGEKDTTLDRMDVDGNYCKENCKWATIKEQNGNRRNVKC